MTAKIINNITGTVVAVHATTDHPASSYGQPVWVDDEGNAYCQVNMTDMFYTVIDVEY